MNGIKIIYRKFLADLAEEVGLNASHFEALGESRQWEIVVGDDMLERLVEIQRQFERLAVMGDDEYRGFYIEVPRPAPEECGNAEELVTSGEYECSDDGDSSLTKEQYNAIVSIAEWQPEERMSLK